MEGNDGKSSPTNRLKYRICRQIRFNLQSLMNFAVSRVYLSERLSSVTVLGLLFVKHP